MSESEARPDRRRGRRLPMVGAGPSRAGVDAVDSERIREGWEHRFVASGERVEEMIALYRELGFEVVADPVTTGGLVDGCAACFASDAGEHRSIYTRRQKPRARAAGRR